MTATFLTLDDLPLTFDTSVRRSTRSQRVQFGDGYSQILTDGLNSEQEIWSCSNAFISDEQVGAVESYLLRNRGSSLSWSPPDSTKSFQAQFSAGTLTLGYTNIDSLELTGYTRPTNYTANLTSGLLTSVTIANSVFVPIVLTLAPRSYILEDGWNLEYVSANLYNLTFALRRVYV